MPLPMQVGPLLLVLLLVEAWLRGWGRPGDYFSSVTAGLLTALGHLALGTGELAAYAWVYGHMRVLDLEWDSGLTWGLGFLGVDFCYYWSHRFSHGELPHPHFSRPNGHGLCKGQVTPQRSTWYGRLTRFTTARMSSTLSRPFGSLHCSALQRG